MSVEDLSYKVQCSHCPWFWADVDKRLVFEALKDHERRRHYTGKKSA